MLTQTAGYIFFAIMAVLFLGISYWAYRRFRVNTVDELVAGGRRTSLGIISASIMASWIWTLTIMGASEAGMWFGFTGGFQYAWGAVVPFMVFIPIALRLRHIMPRATTFTEFVHERFGRATHVLFFVFGVGLALYVFTEQAIGGGILLHTTFGIPFKVGAFLTAALVTTYITLGGLRSSLMTDVVQFFVIAIAVLLLVPALLVKLGGPSFLYQGLTDVVTNPGNVNHNPEALSWMATAGWRYGLTAVVIAMGQVLFEQGYYQRAVTAANSRTLKWAYVLGGVLAWFPIPMAFGTIVGGAGLAMGLGGGNGIQTTSEVAPYLMGNVLGPVAGVLFATMVFMAAASTADTSLAGVQSLFTADFFEKYINRGPRSEKRQMSFGRWVTVVIGMGCGLLATLAEGISLLKFDIAAGILFAAPVGAFVAGMFWKKVSPGAAIASMLIGLGSGVGAWLLIPNDDLNWFIGNILALMVPVVIIFVSSLVAPGDFDFKRLRGWRPQHLLEIDDAALEEGVAGD